MLLRDIAKGMWDLSNQMPFRYFMATLAAVAVAQILFGINLVVLVCVTIGVFLIVWHAKPDFYLRVLFPLACALLVIGFLLGGEFLILLASISFPLIWCLLMNKLIVSVKITAVNALVFLLNVLHLGAAIAYVYYFFN